MTHNHFVVTLMSMDFNASINTGVSISAGIAGGTIAILSSDYELMVTPRFIAKNDIDAELQIFQNAHAYAHNELRRLYNNYQNQLSAPELSIIEAQILLLSDPELYDKVCYFIEYEKHGADYALYVTRTEINLQFKSIKDPVLQQRVVDINDVVHRIFKHLSYDVMQVANKYASIPEDAILLCHDLLPSQLLELPISRIRGVVLHSAIGKYSHIAILLRSLQIPAISKVVIDNSIYVVGNPMYINANTGEVVSFPSEHTKQMYQRLLLDQDEQKKYYEELSVIPAITRDGRSILLEANIEIENETSLAQQYAADGIGLYRSEFLFIMQESIPSEQEQYENYSNVLKAMGDKSVTIRTIDIGADKISAFLGRFVNQERNALLGLRGSRYYVANPEIFTTQIRALLRASVHGNLKILYPMIASVDEVVYLSEKIEQIKNDLRTEGIAFSDSIEFGIMIEIPSSVLLMSIMAEYVDFFSLGTNDLLQYTIAVDRENTSVAYLYDAFQIGFLRVISYCIGEAYEIDVPLSVCGEMAGDPMTALLLIGLGFTQLSLVPVNIPKLKEYICKVEYTQLHAVCMDIVYGCRTSEEARTMMETYVHSLV